MSLFDRCEHASDATQRRGFAARAGWEHHPQARPAGDVNAPLVADPSRPVTSGLDAIYATRATTTQIGQNYDPRSDKRPGISTPADTIETPPDFSVDVKIGDLFVRTADGARWQVASTYSDDQGRTRAAVNRVG